MQKAIFCLVLIVQSFAWADAPKHATGFVKSKEFSSFVENVSHTSFSVADTAIPATSSLRRHAGPVEDQGQCGSCWDFALTTALRGTWITAGTDPGRLSFNYLLNCDKKMLGCEGGDFSAADMLVTPQGAPAYGSDGGYTAYQGTCKQETVVASSQGYHMLGNSSAGPSFKDIAYVVGVLHRPVAIDINATDDFQNYTGGTFSSCSDSNVNDINHMVVVEGYDCEKSKDAKGNCVFDQNGNLPKGVGRWVIRNSWGDNWGDDGYVTMMATDSKGERCNAVATDALYFDVSH